MIKFENVEVMGWEAAIRGMRNPMNSWEKSDSCFTDSWISVNDRLPERPFYDWVLVKIEFNEGGNGVPHVAELINGKWQFQYLDSIDAETTLALRVTHWMPIENRESTIGPNDHKLMASLRSAGTDHRKFMRMITVYVDITAPLYWWKEFDTYKVGTVANSCSTMHKIADKEFTIEDFSTDHQTTQSEAVLLHVIKHLNMHRMAYLTTNTDVNINSTKLSDEACVRMKKDIWLQMIQLLPSSYNQKRTVQLNYEVLANIYKSRKNHKLDEWSVGFMEFIESLPYSELITGEPEFMSKEFHIPKEEELND